MSAGSTARASPSAARARGLPVGLGHSGVMSAAPDDQRFRARRSVTSTLKMDEPCSTPRFNSFSIARPRL